MALIPRMDNPICLIENSADRRLVVNENAQTILAQITQPLVVVSIVGPYRTGKSYLLNKLSGRQRGVFSVDSTIKANTKGIWMWCMPHPIKCDHTLVLLDTEGLGDPGKGDKDNDCMILSLAMLMSSAVIYNSSGVINQDALEKVNSTLNVYIEIVHKASVQKMNTQSQEDKDNMAPLFVWVIRDFTLKSDLDGHSVTADEYLENCLKNVLPVKTPRGHRQNEMRRTIRAHFPKRKCFYFGFPSADKEVLRNMSQVPESELVPEFVRKAEDFCKFILQEASAKRLRDDRIMTGSDFSHLLKSYVDSVTKCDIAHLERSMSNMTLEKNQSSIRRSTESYENKMKAQQFNTEEEFQRLHESLLEEALREFEKSYVTHEKSQDEYLHQLEKDLKERRGELWKICEDSSLKKCEDLLKKLKCDVDQALKENKYHVSGGYDAFLKDKDNTIRVYNEQTDKGVKAQEFLKELSDYLEGIGNTIPKTVQAAKKRKQLKRGDSRDCDQLSDYVQDYQLPSGRFDRLLIQLFGYIGHGKSSFVNSCVYTMSNGKFQDWAGEGISNGGKTMERRAYELTNTISIVDNRGFATLGDAEAWEIYAQLCNFAPFNEKVEWNKSFQVRNDGLIRKMKENKTPDLIVPVFVCSSEHNLSDAESSSIKMFLRKAHQLTGIQPFVVLTKDRKDSGLRTKFAQMGIENVRPIENYIISDHVSDRHKHLNFLNFLKDILQTVNFHLHESVNFETQRYEWMSFLMQMANNI
ncbi:guanylate-binding protein 1-like [Aquarana catesbeiana]|uniref:guanylate-binding protein 1-like n=1 Tax=Aquarana catesbeiana TaxID=8400 RepID=UPI003CCA1428